MLRTLLGFAPLILVTLYAIFVAIIVIDDARRNSKEAPIKNPRPRKVS